MSNYEAIAAKVNSILDELGVETDRERVETIVTNFHASVEKVTPQEVKAAVYHVNHTTYPLG